MPTGNLKPLESNQIYVLGLEFGTEIFLEIGRLSKLNTIVFFRLLQERRFQNSFAMYTIHQLFQVKTFSNFLVEI